MIERQPTAGGSIRLGREIDSKDSDRISLLRRTVILLDSIVRTHTVATQKEARADRHNVAAHRTTLVSVPEMSAVGPDA